MTKAFDFSVEAELFFAQRKYQRSAVGYRRFSYAAEAIRFAIEELPAGQLVGAFIEVDGERYGADKIRSLYDSTDFPHHERLFPENRTRVSGRSGADGGPIK